MAVNKAVDGTLKYEKALGNASSNTLCKRGIQHLHIKFINGRGVYSSIILSPKGGKESKALRAREENQRRVKKKGRQKGRRRKRGKRGKIKENKSTNLLMKKEKNIRGKEMKKNGQGDQCKKTEKLWNQSDNT